MSPISGTDLKSRMRFSGKHDPYFLRHCEQKMLTAFILLFRSKIESQVEFAVDRLVFNTAELEESMSLEEAGLETESSIDALVALDGGKRKRKKKVYTKPKKIKHKHRKRSLALLEYYNIEGSGKIKRLKKECPVTSICAPGTYMADHPDRYHCGKCGYMLYRLTKDGERLPIPENKKPQVAVAVAAAPAKKDAGKKKKK